MFELLTQLTEDYLQTNWAVTPINFDGVEVRPVVGTPFIRTHIEWVDTTPISIGGLDRGIGYLMVSVFTPINEGSRPALALADLIATLFERWTSGDLTYFVARVARVGQYQEWYQVNVLIPFKYDRCH